MAPECVAALEGSWAMGCTAPRKAALVSLPLVKKFIALKESLH